MYSQLERLIGQRNKHTNTNTHAKHRHACFQYTMKVRNRPNMEHAMR